jgi:hypothetical protein
VQDLQHDENGFLHNDIPEIIRENLAKMLRAMVFSESPDAIRRAVNTKCESLATPQIDQA